MVHLRVPDMAYKQAESFAKKFGFGSVQEYAREALRRMNEEYETQQGIRTLEKLRGSIKPTKRMTRDERLAWYEKNADKDMSDIFRKYGFE